ncbi:MAG: Gfo/Idh/MocA family protein [Hydrogenophilus thermoluteolus]
MTNKNTVLNIAFIGGGINSAVGRAHKIAAELDGRFKLIAGCFSRNIEISKKTAIYYGIPEIKAYNHIEELILHEAENIDAIVILTPQHYHFEHIKLCIENNIPVICEKALTSSLSEALKIKNLLNKHSGFLAVINNYTGYPMLRELENLTINKKIGKIHQILCEMPQDAFLRVLNNNKPIIPQSWRLIDKEIPTLSLDLGVHLYMISYFLTKSTPKEVFAFSDNYGNFPNIIDTVHCIAKLENDITGNFWYSKTALGNRNGLRIRLFASHGSAEWVQENPEYLYITDRHGIQKKIDRASPEISVANNYRYQRFKAGHPSGFIEALANYYYDLADALLQFLDQKKFSNDFIFGINESIKSLLFLEAIAQASITRSIVSIK